MSSNLWLRMGCRGEPSTALTSGLMGLGAVMRRRAWPVLAVAVTIAASLCCSIFSRLHHPAARPNRVGPEDPCSTPQLAASLLGLDRRRLGAGCRLVGRGSRSVPAVRPYRGGRLAPLLDRGQESDP